MMLVLFRHIYTHIKGAPIPLFSNQHEYFDLSTVLTNTEQKSIFLTLTCSEQTGS